MIEVTTKQHGPVVQATVFRSDFDFIMQEKQRCVKLVEETYNLLAEGKPLEAKELLQKRVNNEYVNIPIFIEPVEPNCQVRNDDTGELKTMTPKPAEAFARKQALEEAIAICNDALSFPDSKYYIRDKIKELLT